MTWLEWCFIFGVPICNYPTMASCFLVDLFCLSSFVNDCFSWMSKKTMKIVGFLWIPVSCCVSKHILPMFTGGPGILEGPNGTHWSDIFWWLPGKYVIEVTGVGYSLVSKHGCGKAGISRRKMSCFKQIQIYSTSFFNFSIFFGT